ncbi:MAG: 50S ribosomal protein L4 [Thermoplasmata archaeon]|nr:MAG: 50S ribosomal protein L4 [Thermoplasmata archaeon]
MAEKEKEETKKVKKTEAPKTVTKEEKEKPKKSPTVKKIPKKKPKKLPPTKKKGKPKLRKVEKVNLYSIEGKAKRKIDLPKVFFQDVRNDIIKRAVVAAQANRRQPYGPTSTAGMMHSVSTWGKGRGVARVQRLSQGRTAVESPGNIGGRRAHPPRPIKNWSKKINKKERGLATRSALSATKETTLVAQRGHRFDESITLPIIVENSIEKIKTTKEAISTLEKLGVMDDIERAKSGTHIRSGRGKMRGRRYRRPKSLLLVVTDQKRAKRGFGNLVGVDVTTPDHLSIELLAPGGMPGRLAVFTEDALKELSRW